MRRVATIFQTNSNAPLKADHLYRARGTNSGLVWEADGGLHLSERSSTLRRSTKQWADSDNGKTTPLHGVVLSSILSRSTK